MAGQEGQALHALLTDLGCTAVSSFSPNSLDWMFDSPACRPFLQWLLSNISRANLLSPNDLEAFNSLPSSSILQGTSLSSALSSCGLGGEEDTEEEIARQVGDLERELEEQDGMRSRLQEVYEAGAGSLVKQSGEAAQIESLVESASREERRRQEQVIGASASWDLVVRRLENSVRSVAEAYKKGNGMLAAASLNSLRAAEENLDAELKALMARQFGSGDEGLLGGQAPRGRNREEFSSLSRELARLRASLFQAELHRITLEAKQEGLRSVLESGGRREAYIPDDDGGEVEKLEKEVKVALGDLVDAQCQRVIGEDFREKAERGEEVISWLEGVKDILVQQAARGEVLSLVGDQEKVQVEQVVKALQEVTSDCDQNARHAIRWCSAASNMKEEKRDGLVGQEDPVTLRIHRLLGLSNHCPEHLATYSVIKDCLDQLVNNEEQIEREVCSGRGAREMQLQLAGKDASLLARELWAGGTDKRRANLAPRRLREGVAVLETGLSSLERNLKKQLEDWEKQKQELRRNPHLSIQRDVWVDFLVRPKVLTANLKSLENKLKNYQC